MVDIDVLKAQLVRQDPSEPWGFRLHGGTDFNNTLSIIRIIPGSPAAKIGLEPGDEIVEIGDRNTSTLTQQQALDLIDSHADTLTMTVERRVTNSNQPPRFVTTAQLSPTQPYKSYQPLDLTGSSRHVVNNSNHIHPGFDFQTVQARPFEAARPKSSVQSQQPPAQHDVGEYYDTPVHHVSADIEYLPCPQSRTFRMLQTVMHNEEPAAGVSGLPPPRSATMEYMRQQQRQSGGQRVKVFMPQQYNSPMGMYSAHNVLETFTAQAETMLDTIERRHL